MTDTDSPRHKYERERERIEEQLEGANREHVLELLDALDPEVRRPTFEHDGEKTTLASSSLFVYGARLRLLSGEVGKPLIELTNPEIDDLADGLLDGSTGIGPADGYSVSWVQQAENALKAFFRYHEGHDVDPEEIPMESQERTSVDERALWTVDEVNRMRSVIDSKRNEAFFELLAYTGQRIRVVQTLRVKDVDPDAGDTGRYYVNDEVEGRKNRDGHGPLLGARGAVRRWLEVHPTKGEPDHEEHALITAMPNTTGTPGEPLTQTTLRDILRDIADRAGVEKDVHPHMFRHYFTTMARKPKSRGGFEIDPDHIKRLRGDSPGSTVMETTYQHLGDEDSSEHAEDAFRGEEPEGNALLPAGPCGTCGEMLDAGDKACPNCGHRRALIDESEVDTIDSVIERLKEAEEEIARLKSEAAD